MIFRKRKDVVSVQFGKSSARSGPRRWFVIEIPIRKLGKRNG